MQGQITLKKRPKGLSIFHRFLISYLGLGVIIVVITSGEYYLREQKTIKEELRSQFLNSLGTAIAYFDKTYGSRIKEDLSFVEKSYNFNSYLSSEKDEMLLAKSLAEQLFLHFTNKPKGIYLSARFIDSRGIERIITSGNKRLRDYASLDSLSSTDILYSKIYTLFKRLKSQKVGTILFEGPFQYGGKFTFVVGISKSEPEVGGFAGAVIFHCDLTDYSNYLDRYVFYKQHVARAVTLDDKQIFVPGQNTLSWRNPVSFYSISNTVNMGSDNQALLKVVFSISPDIFRAELRNTFKNLILYIFVIMVLVVILALVMSKQFSTPLVGLAASANRLAKGDLSTRVNVKANGEIGLLVESFNNMAEDLQKTTVSRDTLIQEITEHKKAEEERERLIKELKEGQELLKGQKQELEDSRRAINNVAKDLRESKEILEYQKRSLEETNKELDDFTYIVSHDLKEPLRSIDAYSKFIVDDYQDKLGEEGGHYLERIRANTERMRRLIEDLLEISRLKKRGSAFEEAEIEELIGEVKMRLEYPIKQKGVEIIIKDKLPKIFCDRVRLTEVFLNLISNAIKFNDKPKPIIEIGCNDKGNFYEFYVKDNAVGIKEEYFDKIFEIFQRLGKREDAEGTGAGLTIVKKIIQLHKGKIWLESKIGEGSTFYFTIPREKSMILGKKLLGEILIEKKLVTEEDIKKALEEQERKGEENGRIA